MVTMVTMDKSTTRKPFVYDSPIDIRKSQKMSWEKDQYANHSSRPKACLSYLRTLGIKASATRFYVRVRRKPHL